MRIGVDVVEGGETSRRPVTAFLADLSWYRHEDGWICMYGLSHAMIRNILGYMYVGIHFSIQPASYQS
jgi:hypothetical protein